MIKLTVKDRAGADHTIETAAEGTLMEAIRDYGLTDEFALCGGHCSCATCHVIIEEAFVPKLNPLAEGEDGLLDGADDRQAGSRLSCQVPLSSDLDGMQLRIAEAS